MPAALVDDEMAEAVDADVEAAVAEPAGVVPDGNDAAEVEEAGACDDVALSDREGVEEPGGWNVAGDAVPTRPEEWVLEAEAPDTCYYGGPALDEEIAKEDRLQIAVARMVAGTMHNQGAPRLDCGDASAHEGKEQGEFDDGKG